MASRTPSILGDSVIFTSSPSGWQLVAATVPPHVSTHRFTIARAKSAPPVARWREASPVFSPDGKLVGISIIRKGTGALSSGTMQPGIPVVLPARDVLQIADQARTAKPEKAGDATENPESN